jgi:hypothetical protein
MSERRHYTLNQQDFWVDEKYLLAMVLAVTVAISEMSGGESVYYAIERITNDLYGQIEEGQPRGTEESTGDSGQPAG